ncbi:MAG: hypothetical protein PHU49_11285 [Syntrophorhabdaceae bacterium]|nr:hypothetical protein [Syntrophorhabdaceae bacterium]
MEIEEPVVYRTKAEAQKDYEHCTMLQPENIYKIEKINGGDFPWKVLPDTRATG